MINEVVHSKGQIVCGCKVDVRGDKSKTDYNESDTEY